ncbi:class I SAM-dependent methyltransferase [Candidatus Pristimantibacillus sp. PTI5]|uniref:class I SAM-dependent methyltransferase n=1 Tax=Candidatus Pristimantibacillus sp. PTI5 TaxID=3400422 RepID=UPI003B01B4E5
MERNKVKLNLSYYKGIDYYSDGEVEDELLEIVRNYNSYDKILHNNERWPILYHLSPIRWNLLEWYPFDKEASLLEIGAGCGALTGLFCKQVNQVTAVELSRKRAEIISERCKDHDNLEILVGNMEDIRFEKKFDFITLIGVLEYAGKYISGPQPHKKFIELVRSFLKPNGTLIIAIENKFGLKYWAGAREDHSGKLFESIEGYLDNDGVETFSRMELEELLIASGMTNNQFYYPLPDYKLPNQIYSDHYLPKPGAARITPNYDRNRYLMFNEQSTFNQIVENNQFPFFANSFLTFSRQGDE